MFRDYRTVHAEQYLIKLIMARLDGVSRSPAEWLEHLGLHVLTQTRPMRVVSEESFRKSSYCAHAEFLAGQSLTFRLLMIIWLSSVKKHFEVWAMESS